MTLYETCPACGVAPGVVVGMSAFCDNDACGVHSWDMDEDPQPYTEALVLLLGMEGADSPCPMKESAPVCGTSPQPTGGAHV